MESFVKQTLLYDFYGDLLTDHQKEVYEAYTLENFTLAEIADEYGISRQGVYDLLKRCNSALEEYESRLHLVEKFLLIKDKVRLIRESSDITQMRSIAEEIIESL